MARNRDRTKEYERNKQRRAEEEARKQIEAAEDPDEQAERQKRIKAQLIILAERTAHLTVMDHDADIQWAYRAIGNPNVMPLDAPTVTAWSWYEYARADGVKFLDVVAKREDQKIKQSGSLTNQRMEDDKRKQFAVLDRIGRQLTADLNATIDDFMTKFPDDVLRACKRHEAAWKSFLERNP